MKRLLLYGIMGVMLLVLIVGCGGQEAESPPVQEDASAEKPGPEAAVEEAPADEPQQEEGTLLEGKELIASLDFQAPGKLYIKAKSEGGGFSHTITTSIDGENMRSETVGDDVHQVTIYNAEARTTYTYTVGEGMGFAFSDEEDDEDFDEGEGMDFGAWEDPEDLLEGIDESGLRAEKTTFKGQPALYIETSFDSGGEGTWETKQWISAESGIPLKMESYSSGELLSLYEVLEIDTNPSFSADVFLPPEDVEFMGFDTLFDPSMMEDMDLEDLDLP